MTRKDYKLLTQHLGGSLAAAERFPDRRKYDVEVGAWSAIGEVAKALAEDNPKFDKNKFFDAVLDCRDDARKAHAEWVRSNIVVFDLPAEVPSNG